MGGGLGAEPVRGSGRLCGGGRGRSWLGGVCACMGECVSVVSECVCAIVQASMRESFKEGSERG